MPPTPRSPTHYPPNEYIQTAQTGNKVSRRSTILGSQNIILGGKCIIQNGVIIRGDLKRSQPPSQTQAVVIYIGRYCTLAEGCIVRPPYKTYKGIFSYYPVKIGDHVTIGSGTITEAASIGSHVEIGRNCVIGRFSIIKDSVKILDNTVIAPNTVISSSSVFAGCPGKEVEGVELEETWSENLEKVNKAFYLGFRPLTSNPS
ncbi:putative dynactin Arp1 p25 subunit RO12 [Violaceomyces palustris]|uniref:Dynactin Arp1 p25 subunit RO12 n=1 Tax=Violaceomyces palustris TaxID=1673888 RepID=A0ACD0NQF3_9BASI|nr:putative dynactin Arp1 p25 subunit RO12 [Violaceomyces palustris]